MKRLIEHIAAGIIIIAASGCAGSAALATLPRPLPSSTIPPTTSPIKHVVIIFQENRTPDNLFHGLAGADIANSGKDSHGRTIVLVPSSLSAPYDLGHTHADFSAAYNGGRMNGFDKEAVNCKRPPCQKKPQYVYVPTAETGPYFQMAQQYTFGDRMFQTNQGPSFPAHQYIIAGTSEPSFGSPLLAAENPLAPSGETIGGCDAPSGTTVQMIDPVGKENTLMYPCFEHPAITDLFDAKGMSWKYYAPGPDSIWTGPNSIRHIRFGPDWNDVVIPQTNVLGDIAANQLSAVSWVIPDGPASDHPLATNGTGPSWVASIVNAIGQSAYWKDTAIFITWDDWGGFYDHVKPPTIFNSYELGLRVPFIVVSAYAKPAYISKVDHEFGSILRYIEENYGLGSLRFTDARADNLSDCFNYLQTPNVFKLITAPAGPKYFLRAGAPHGPPDSY